VCGRFTLTTSPEQVAEHFELEAAPQLAPRFNVAPTQPVATIDASSGTRSLALRRWGLIPPWAEDERIASRQINARVETVADKPAYRHALRERRCIVPADGFYEWSGAAGSKQPHHIGVPDGELFGFAGLWESWRDATDTPIETCVILTTEANGVLGGLHRRMPVILHPSRYDAWLDAAEHEPSHVLTALDSRVADTLTFAPVSYRVNDVANDDPGCLSQVETQPNLF
jgi:putative SOS response-associated peptidase YedK